MGLPFAQIANDFLIIFLKARSRFLGGCQQSNSVRPCEEGGQFVSLS